MDLRVRQAELRSFAKERDWDQYHSPKNLAMALVVEAGELLEIFQWLTEQQSVDLGKSDAELRMAGEELADILIYLVRLADVLGLDLDAALGDKLEMNRRKYPIDLVKGSPAKYTKYTTTEQRPPSLR